MAAATLGAAANTERPRNARLPVRLALQGLDRD